jgi:hypothetical protein
MHKFLHINGSEILFHVVLKPSLVEKDATLLYPNSNSAAKWNIDYKSF